jgi:hypothetical protein
MKLLQGNARDGRPEGGGFVNVETLVQVDANPKPGLIDVKEFAQPDTEEPHHRRITIGKAHGAIPLCSLTGVQRRPGGQERLAAETAEPGSAVAVHRLDLGCLPPLQDIRSSAPGPPARPGRELHAPHPQGYRRPGDTQLGCDVGEGPTGGAQLASAILRLHLSTVTHGLSAYRTGVR